MNERLQYELLIADKLEELPVPDMADQVWSRISAQLDIDMPADDDDTDLPSNPRSGGPLGWGLPILLIALLTMYFYYHNNSNNSSINDQPAEPGTSAAPPIVAPQSPSITPTSPPRRPGVQSLPLQPGNGSKSDSTQQPLAPLHLPAPDSAGVIKVDSLGSVALPAVVKPDSLPQKKKSRGVAGIKDSDYRIVPKNQ